MVLPLRDQNPTRGRPVVTVALMLVCLATFVGVQPTTGTVDDAAFLFRNAAIPCELREQRPLTLLEVPTVAAQQAGGPFTCDRGPDAPPYDAHKHVWWSAIVSLFLHGSWMHLLGNLLFLWIFGNNVEDRFRPWWFLPFYVLGGIVALGAHVGVDAGSTQPVIGASGAIAAVMGAYLVWYPRARVLSVVPPIFFYPFYLPAWIVLSGWFVLQFFTSPNSGVAWVAHVGGFVFGVVAAFLLRRARPDRRTPRYEAPAPWSPPPDPGWV